MSSTDTDMALRVVLQRTADVLFDTLDLVESCQVQVGALLSCVTEIPPEAHDLQQLDRISQTLQGLSVILSRAASVVPQDLCLSHDELTRGVGLATLVERVETGEVPILDLEETDDGEFEAF
jgi:hypothetical protein